jgi:CheY-like chemotaxis protein
MLPPPALPTVLVVDDAAPLRRALQRALGRVGYHVIAAASAATACALLIQDGSGWVAAGLRDRAERRRAEGVAWA